mmetsp:Transcript_11873/g.33007  ORF Transcript_11873/g.33007 Transcript_11873/m.33007 type:complete len:120 (-) Transcript_11873:267-626(-)
MLDTKQMLPRVLAGSLCMFLTIALVSLFAYQVLESSGAISKTKPDDTANHATLSSPLQQASRHSKAWHRIHTRGRNQHESRTRKTPQAHAHLPKSNQRRLLEQIGTVSSSDAVFHNWFE